MNPPHPIGRRDYSVGFSKTPDSGNLSGGACSSSQRYKGTPLPPFSQVFILKGVKVVCFDTLLQVLILREMEAAIKPGFRETMEREEIPPPRVFSEKRLQTIENKGNEGRKE